MHGVSERLLQCCTGVWLAGRRRTYLGVKRLLVCGRLCELAPQELGYSHHLVLCRLAFAQLGCCWCDESVLEALHVRRHRVGQLLLLLACAVLVTEQPVLQRAQHDGCCCDARLWLRELVIEEVQGLLG